MSLTRPKVLVAPLDWGLGHATRCIPIIKKLENQACEITIASSGPQKNLLSDEFPRLKFIDLPGYGPQYGKSGWSTRLNLLFQTPKILRRIKAEQVWLQKILSQESFDLLISDNRYGLFAPGLVTVFITHQLCVYTGFGRFLDRKLSSQLLGYIHRFSYCWIPDQEFAPFLGGALSHPHSFPQIHHRYIGLLSRFIKLDLPLKKDSLLVILSGPEPQRSIFEKKIIQELTEFNGDCTLVRGLPGSDLLPASVPGLKFFNHLPSNRLNQLICESEFILCRSGYSSIMELVALEKKSIMVPTPGQAEQEYLAEFLHQEQIVMKADQSNFRLSSSLREAKRFPYRHMSVDIEGKLESAIREVLQSVE
ncbi:MAG: glycosyltransferase [Chitinophagales bacterium]